MPLFGSAGNSPGVLKQEQIKKLVTPSAGEEEILNSLKKFGIKTTKAVGTVVVTCRYVKYVARELFCSLQEWKG